MSSSQPRRMRPEILCLLLLMVLALVVRLHRMDRDMNAFHPTWQYHSALIARAYFLETTASKASYLRASARLHIQKYGAREPRIMQRLAAWSYTVTGGENPRIPRIFAVIFWLAGGVVLFGLVRRLFGTPGAFISVSFFFFFPFGISMSRSFMPESLMILFFLMAVNRLSRYTLGGSRTDLIGAAVSAGLSVLVKFVVLFPLAGGYMLQGIRKYGIKRFIQRRETHVSFSIVLTLGFSYYLVHAMISMELARTAYRVMMPQLLITPFFWWGWLQQIGKVTGLLPFVAAIIAVMFMKQTTTRRLLAGLLGGYFIYGLIFSYSTATHDYYHVALFPIVAIALGHWGVAWTRATRTRRSTAAGVLVLLTFFALMHESNPDRGRTRFRPFSAAWLLVGDQRPGFQNQIVELDIAATAATVGRLIGHETNTIALSRAYGFPLFYLGAFYGHYWPTHEDFRYWRLRGQTILSAPRFYARRFSHLQPHYFVVTDMDAWKRQKDLRDFLYRRFYLLRSEKNFLVFDLTRTSDGRETGAEKSVFP